MAETFMMVDEHFKSLLSAMDQGTQDMFKSLKHARPETAFRGRHFVVYHMLGAQPTVIDRLVIDDFECDDEVGATADITSLKLQKTMTLDYHPRQILGHPVMAWLPLHSNVRWGAPASTPEKGSLGFPMVLRTRSRFNLRERGVVYCETGPAYGAEFDTVSV